MGYSSRICIFLFTLLVVSVEHHLTGALHFPLRLSIGGGASEESCQRRKVGHKNDKLSHPTRRHWLSWRTTYGRLNDEVSPNNVPPKKSEPTTPAQEVDELIPYRRFVDGSWRCIGTTSFATSETHLVLTSPWFRCYSHRLRRSKYSRQN